MLDEYNGTDLVNAVDACEPDQGETPSLPLTSRSLAEQYPVKGSMPIAVVQQLYDLRENEVERLSQQGMITVADLRGLDRGARFLVAHTLYAKCDDAARYALLHDVHPHVRSGATSAQSDLETAS